MLRLTLQATGQPVLLRMSTVVSVQEVRAPAGSPNVCTVMYLVAGKPHTVNVSESIESIYLQIREVSRLTVYRD